MASSVSGNEAAVNEKSFLTHSSELYGKGGNKYIMELNVKVLDLLSMSLNHGSSGDQQFLDIGCGVGDLTRDEILPRSLPCKRLVATDLSNEMLNYAKQNFAHPKITYDFLDIGGDVSSFVKKYGEFDRVYSFCCLNWVQNKKVAMLNIHQLLKPGGECLLFFPLGGRLYENWKRIGAMERWKAYKPVRAKTNFPKPSI